MKGPRLNQLVLPHIMAVLLASAWLLPNHSTPWYSFHSEVLAVGAGIALVGLAIGPAWQRSTRVPMPATVLLLVALVPWVQWLFGRISFYGDALLASIYIAGVALCFWAAFASAHDSGSRLRRVLSYALLWSSIASSGIAVLEWWGGVALDLWALETPPGSRAVGNLGQPNHLAVLLMFGIASIAWLQARNEIGTKTALLASSLLVLGASLTASRTPWLGVLLLTVWIPWAKTAKSATRGQRLMAVALLLEYGLFYWAIQFQTDPLHGQAITVSYERLQPGLRPLMWSQFLVSIQESPWFGYGWQGGQAAQATAALAKPGLEVSIYAHNMFLDLVVWNGVPLGALLGFLMLMWYLRLGRHVGKHGDWFPFALLTFFFAHALVEYPHAYTYFLMPVALAAGQLQASISRATTVSAPSGLMVVFGLAIVAAAVAVMLDYLSLADDQREVMFWQAKIGGTRTLSPPPHARVLNQLAASAHWARIAPESGMDDQEIRDQLTLTRRFPSTFLLHQSIMMLALNGRPEDALIELHRLRGLQGETAYKTTVEQVRKLADDQHPSIRRLIQLVDSTALRLPPLPKLSEAMTGRG